MLPALLNGLFMFLLGMVLRTAGITILHWQWWVVVALGAALIINSLIAGANQALRRE